MSDTSQGAGWWLASDGKWYPPQAAPGNQRSTATLPPPGGEPSSSTPGKKRHVLRWVLVAAALVVILAIIGAAAGSKDDKKDAVSAGTSPGQPPSDDGSDGRLENESTAGRRRTVGDVGPDRGGHCSGTDDSCTDHGEGERQVPGRRDGNDRRPRGDRERSNRPVPLDQPILRARRRQSLGSGRFDRQEQRLREGHVLDARPDGTQRLREQGVGGVARRRGIRSQSSTTRWRHRGWLISLWRQRLRVPESVGLTLGERFTANGAVWQLRSFRVTSRGRAAGGSSSASSPARRTRPRGRRHRSRTLEIGVHAELLGGESASPHESDGKPSRHRRVGTVPDVRCRTVPREWAASHRLHRRVQPYYGAVRGSASSSGSIRCSSADGSFADMTSSRSATSPHVSRIVRATWPESTSGRLPARAADVAGPQHPLWAISELVRRIAARPTDSRRTLHSLGPRYRGERIRCQPRSMVGPRGGARPLRHGGRDFERLGLVRASPPGHRRAAP